MILGEQQPWGAYCLRASMSKLSRFVVAAISFGLLSLGNCYAQSWGTVGFGYNYLLTEKPTGNWVSSHGWYALPTVSVTKHLGVFADFTNFYSKGQNIHGYVFGPMYQFTNESRVTPFVFTGAGDVRTSADAVVANNFAWVVGSGFLMKLNSWLSLQTIPVEYVLNTPNSSVGNNFLARAGFVITIPKK